MHVLVDGRQRKGADCTCRLMEDWLDRAVLHSGLTQIAGPQVKAFQGHIHGWAMIAESHISGSVDCGTGEAHLEMFSCRWFDAEAFVGLCVDMWELEAHSSQWIKRELD